MDPPPPDHAAAAPRAPAPAPAAVPPLTGALKFSHACDFVACADDDCPKCANAPHRRCVTQLALSAVVGDQVRSPCGRPVTAAVVTAGSPIGPAHGGVAVRLDVVSADAFDLAMYGCLLGDEAVEGGGVPAAPKRRRVDGDGAVIAAADIRKIVVAVAAIMGDSNVTLTEVETAVRTLAARRVGGAALRCAVTPAATLAAVERARVELAPSVGPHTPPSPQPSSADDSSQAQPLGADALRGDCRRGDAARGISQQPGGRHRRMPPAPGAAAKALLSHTLIPVAVDANVVSVSLANVHFNKPTDALALVRPTLDLPLSRRVLHALLPPGEWTPSAAGAVRMVATLVFCDTGAPIPDVLPAVSSPFVVAASRPRLVKVDRPLVTEPVSVVHGVGVNMVGRLQDLVTTGANLGIVVKLPPELRSVPIATVGDMMRIVAFADADNELDTALRRTLALSRKQWADVKVALARAVEPDARLRVYYSGDHLDGLVFRGVQGAPDLAAPVAVLKAIVVPTVSDLPVEPARIYRDLSSPGIVAGYAIKRPHALPPAELERIMRAAKSSWLEPDHVGHHVLRAGGRTFDAVEDLYDYVLRAGNQVVVDDWRLLDVFAYDSD